MIAIDGCYGLGPPRLENADPLTIYCPKCGALAGNSCIGNNGHEFSKAHDRRRKYAHDIAVIKFKSRGRKKIAKGGWGMPKF